MEYIYYWYHHNEIPLNTQIKIHKAIERKDFDSFIKYYQKYNCLGIKQGFYHDELGIWVPVCYLPEQIAVFDNDEVVDYVSILEKSNFEKILLDECEWG